MHYFETLGITVDNASANTTFIECLGEILNKPDVEDLHFRCLSHILNLGVQDMLKIFNGLQQFVFYLKMTFFNCIQLNST